MCQVVFRRDARALIDPILTCFVVTGILYDGNMSSKVLLTGAATAIDQANTALDSLFAAGVAPADGKDAIMWLREVEVLRRRVDSAATLLVGVIDQRALHVDDGHASAGTMAQHVARLSGAESSARQKTAKACRDLPMLADAWSNGEIGTEQMHLLGRVHSNERVAPAMEARQDELLADANNMSAKQFEMKTRRWERLIDEDGPEPANERNHKNRNATLRPNPWDSSWDLTGFFASLQGVEMREIFDVFVEAEFQADWAEAKARLGDAVTGADLNRTPAQRRADALFRIFQVAATAPDGAIPPGFIHNIHWSAAAFEEMLRSMEHDRPPKFDPDDFMCRSQDGHDVDPTEAGVTTLFSQFRRIVVDANGVVIDLGRARRFTGSARTAATAPHTCCVWPGCHVSLSACEVDHLIEHSRNGPTNPSNASPLCGLCRMRHKPHYAESVIMPNGGADVLVGAGSAVLCSA